MSDIEDMRLMRGLVRPRRIQALGITQKSKAEPSSLYYICRPAGNISYDFNAPR